MVKETSGMSGQKPSTEGTALEALYQNIKYSSTWKQPPFTVGQSTHFPQKATQG